MNNNIKFSVLVDCREKKIYADLFKLFENLDINLCNNIQLLPQENMIIGDIVIRLDNKDLIIIERKTVADLKASIFDKRYEEQSYRLGLLETPKHNIIYLIEGDIRKCNDKDKKILYSSIFSCNYFKGFSVYRSMSIEETAYIIFNMCIKLHTEYIKGKINGFYNEPSISNIQSIEYNYDNIETTVLENKTPLKKEMCDMIYTKKNDKITPQNINEIMLCNIPTISSITAIAIIEKYGSIHNLVENLKNNPDCLNNLTYKVGNTDKTRKINKTSISKIKEYLIYTQDNEHNKIQSI